MDRTEFFNNIAKYGFNLKDFHLYIDKISYIPDSYSIIQERNTWTIYYSDERNDLRKFFQGNETETFDFFFIILVNNLYPDYLNHSISEDVVLTKKSHVYDYFHTNFQVSDWELDQTWENLTKNLHILNEVKYYSLTGNFVPAADAYRVQGYTAEELFTRTKLNVIGAYNYLIYLCENPDEALNYLAKGLPVQ